MAYPKVTLLILPFMIASIIGCHRNHAQTQGTQVVYEYPPPPVGTEKYCWQEPKVVHESNGPGVDEQGHWYSPSYSAVREVKMGKWEPCPKGAQ